MRASERDRAQVSASQHLSLATEQVKAVDRRTQTQTTTHTHAQNHARSRYIGDIEIQSIEFSTFDFDYF